MRLITPALCLALAACGNAGAVPVPPSSLAKPSARLLVPPKELPDVAEHDSLYDANAVCRAEYGALATQVKGLIRWTVIVTKAR